MSDKIDLEARCSEVVSIDDEPLPFGKYRGDTPNKVADKDPSYIIWLCEHLDDWYKYVSDELYQACIDDESN